MTLTSLGLMDRTDWLTDDVMYTIIVLSHTPIMKKSATVCHENNI